jgi:FtsP/CotA-like multicopper oxidase with cupredoxin domain
VTLASKNGVLEVRLTARQGAALLDTVTKPVQNVLLFDYDVIRGAPSEGKMSGGGLYPAPTLKVFPGETLIVHLDDALSDLTIADYFSPRYTATNGAVPLYPEQMKSSPVNLHMHGLHVSPKGNSDNVIAAHRGRHVEHIYLQHPKEHAARRILVSQPPSHLDGTADLYRSGGSSVDRAHGRQPSGGDEKTDSDPRHAASV